MRHTCCLTLGLAMFSLASLAASQEISATVDGNLVHFQDVQPMVLRNRVMVPVRGVFEHMNASVDWNAAEQCVYAQRGATSIRLPIGSNTATVDGRLVRFDAPAMMRHGRAMVPLRFLSESLGATVDWIPATWTVEINTAGSGVIQDPTTELALTRLSTGTVLPFTLNQNLSSNGSKVGDWFSGSLVTDGEADYLGIPRGSKIEGHVEVARPRSGTTPGVLGLAFDRIRLADDRTIAISGKLIGLDSNSVSNVDGKLTAKPRAKNDNLKFVGYGAGGGLLLAILTKENVISSTLIGAALGYLYSEIQKNPSLSQNVSLDEGSKFGVRLTREHAFRITVASTAK